MLEKCKMNPKVANVAGSKFEVTEKLPFTGGIATI